MFENKSRSPATEIEIYVWPWSHYSSHNAGMIHSMTETSPLPSLNHCFQSTIYFLGTTYHRIHPSRRSDQDAQINAVPKAHQWSIWRFQYASLDAYCDVLSHLMLLPRIVNISCKEAWMSISQSVYDWHVCLTTRIVPNKRCSPKIRDTYHWLDALPPGQTHHDRLSVRKWFSAAP
jgi:hypothetical protein